MVLPGQPDTGKNGSGNKTIHLGTLNWSLSPLLLTITTVPMVMVIVEYWFLGAVSFWLPGQVNIGLRQGS